MALFITASRPLRASGAGEIFLIQSPACRPLQFADVQ